ncbi:programmed cell death protein 2-like isoform X2 [Phlebotomus papatasi]|uniref:programmed cell death protein 2-like isoform X2 n=1 Tax=Phlebotomus papatasi TaxID=29031 RepID=UPI002483F357|nr:programmed cell death protein 2-like isoform X2 [Phlebotomus papatasi]
MAVNWPIVYLGYPDECVTEKHASSVDFTTNKIGGNPDWPISGITVPNCPLCGLARPLILQIYAPLEGSQFHRTLYVFSCVNSCSNQSSSWLCVRSQTLEKTFEKENSRIPHQGPESQTMNVNWCAGANDWDVPDESKIADVENCNEENGNTISKLDKMSDEDDESNSTEVDLLNIIENVHIDERNANSGAQEGAAAINNSPKASAEIETDETELIIIDTPEAPQRDLIALFKQNSVLSSEQVNLTLRSFFISVDEENQSSVDNSDHIRDLIHEYQKKDDDLKKSPEGASAGDKRGELLGDGEQYEKGVPAHGDVMFHAFITRIQENPGQILRYSRNTVPLLISYLKESIPKCTYCGSDLICEVQILPTIIPHLQLENCDAAPIEFGNVLIYTCAKNCWDTPDKMRIETVIVQQET